VLPAVPLLTLGLAVGCGGDPRPVQAEGPPTGDWTACSDPHCRSQLLPEAWRRDPDAVTATLLDLDPLAQEAALRTLAAHEARALQQLCPQLRGPVADTCRKLVERPHLSMELPPDASTDVPTRQAPGPSGAHLPRPPTAGRADIHSAALLDALRACDAQPAGPARDECSFQAAEAWVRDGGMDHWAEGMAACATSGPFLLPCAQHLLNLATPPASPADAPTADAVATLAAAEQQLAGIVGPDLAPLYVDRLRAHWVAAAFRGADRVTGHLLDALPADGAPHVRMAAAWTLLLRPDADTPGVDAGLDALVASVETHLADRGPVLAEAGRNIAAELSKPADLWPADQGAAEALIPAVSCLGDGRRALGPSEREDLQIAVLEAAARLSPPAPRAVFLDGAAEGRSPIVRWTAVRLGRGVYGPEGWPAVGVPGPDAPPG